MNTFVQGVWEACGRPAPHLALEAVPPGLGAYCRQCGAPITEGARREVWEGSNYTNQNRSRCHEGTHICGPCVYVCGRLSPVPGRPPKAGKANGGNFRNYSHWLVETPAGVEYGNASKGEKPAILAFLRAPKVGPWGCGIADSGQKHVIPWVPINGPGLAGRVLFEETLVTLPSTPAGWTLVDAITAMLDAGVTKEELATGAYSTMTLMQLAPMVDAFEARWSGVRGGSWFDLALWLSQRNEAAQPQGGRRGGRIGRR